MNNLFHSATLRLTGWYLLIIMIVSVSFSVLIYQVSSDEIGRGLPPSTPGNRIYIVDRDAFEAYRQVRIDDANTRLVRNLTFVNLATLALGGGAAYLLARRTLKPIEETMEMQSRFTSDASHELRTPLASMQTENEVALRNVKLSKHDMRALLESNLEEVHRLRQLSDRLLQLSQSQSLEKSPVSVETIIADVLTRQLAAANQKSITLVTDADDAMVLANHESVADMLSIIIENAIKYSPEKSTVRLLAKTKGQRVEFTVSDQGIGIAEKDMAHIFDRFYRVDDSRTKQTIEGHGLGLSIAQRIAHLHKTKISVKSVIGKGTTLSFNLPHVS